ncbi:MAG: anti-sigma factor [Trueperaceae bacterium]
MSRPRELLTDYARGALPDADAVRLEEHLGSCASCRSEVREVREGFVELVEGLPRAALPTGSWRQVIGRIRRRKRRGSRRMAWGLAASLLLLASGGIWSLQVMGRAATADLEAATVARWLARDDVTTLSLGIYPSGGHGSILVLPDDRTLFVLSDAPGRGSSYQAWGHRDGTSESLGVFGRPVFEVSSAGYDSVGVSLEPRGGSPVPTHPLGRTGLP